MIGKVVSITSSVILNGNETHHSMEGWSMMGGAWWIWLIMILAVILIIGLLVVLLMGEDRKREDRSDIGKSAEQILDERYARGEINEEEYKEKKKEMRK